MVKERMEYVEGRQSVKTPNAKWHPAAVLIEDSYSGTAIISNNSNSRTTRIPPREVSTTAARHSRLKSSSTYSTRKRRPSASVSETKSSDQR
jgi:hypothetical protein